jgi:hypothetical protein
MVIEHAYFEVVTADFSSGVRQLFAIIIHNDFKREMDALNKCGCCACCFLLMQPLEGLHAQHGHQQ